MAGTTRRTFLRTVSAGIAGTGVAGIAGADSLEDRYRTVIDVADAGADRTGSTSVSPLLQELLDDDTLLKFPPGRYDMDEQVRASGLQHAGLVGDDATLVPANYHDFDGPQYRLFRLGVHDDPGRDIHVENFTIDQRDSATGIRAFHVCASDDLLVRNIDVVGRHTSGTWGPGLFRITDPAGSGRVVGFRMPDGADWESETPGDLWRGPTGILVNGHTGHLRLDDCVVRNFPDNGLYVTGSGSVSITGGHFQNNGPVNVRIGAARGQITGTQFVVDTNPPAYAAQIPIRVDYADRIEIENVDVRQSALNGASIQIEDGVDDAWIEDSSLTIGAESAPGIVAEPGSGRLAIVDTDVEIDGSANAIRILGPDGGSAVVQGGRIDGDASGGTLRHAIRCERDDCEFRDLTIDQWGPDRRRGLALLGQNGTLYRCRFRATDRPVTVRGDDVWIEDCYFDSYSGDESLKIGSGVDGFRIKGCEFPDGIWNASDDGGTVTGTSY